MKQIYTLIFITLSLALAACSPSIAPVTESAVLPLHTNTATSVPTETSMPPTPTIITETVAPTPAIPDYVQPFFEGGYDKKSTDDELYFVYDETSVHYLSGNSIVFNERIIKSWAEIDYVENGILKRGIILDLVIRGGNDNLTNIYGKFVWASSQSQMGTNPSLSFMEKMDKFFADSTPDTSHPIMHAPLIYHPTGATQLYEGIFPIVDGRLQPVNIPGIGTVLPICNVKPLDIP